MAASRCSSAGVGDGERSQANLRRIRDDVDEQRLRRPPPPSDGAWWRGDGDGEAPNPAGGGAGSEAAP